MELPIELIGEIGSQADDGSLINLSEVSSSFEKQTRILRSERRWDDLLRKYPSSFDAANGDHPEMFDHHINNGLHDQSLLRTHLMVSVLNDHPKIFEYCCEHDDQFDITNVHNLVDSFAPLNIKKIYHRYYVQNNNPGCKRDLWMTKQAFRNKYIRYEISLLLFIPMFYYLWTGEVMCLSRQLFQYSTYVILKMLFPHYQYPSFLEEIVTLSYPLVVFGIGSILYTLCC